MPTTPNGTAYTVTSHTLGSETVYYGVANSVAGNSNLPFVLYLHGAAGAANQFSNTTTWQALRNRLIDEGFAYGEGSMGGLQPWGNQASEDAANAAMTYFSGVLSIGTIVVLGRSMNGALGARFYSNKRGSDARYVGLIVNSGVQDLVWAYDYDSNRWTDAFNDAWNVSNKTEFIIAVSGLNPIDGPATKWDGANVLQMWGDADTTVPSANNAVPMRAMYAGHPAIDITNIRPGGTHDANNGSNLQVDPMMDFLYTVTGHTPAPPEVLTVNVVIARYYKDTDGYHVINQGYKH